MDLPIQLRITHNIRQRRRNLLKFGDIFVTSLIKLALEGNASVFSKIKKVLHLCCHKFLALVIVVTILRTKSVSQKAPFAIETIECSI